eukprot:7759564-Alexandrium_andersonii.AAC.1
MRLVDRTSRPFSMLVCPLVATPPDGLWAGPRRALLVRLDPEARKAAPSTPDHGTGQHGPKVGVVQGV